MSNCLFRPSRELAPEDLELIDFARQIVDANTDGESGILTMGAAVRGADGRMYGGINALRPACPRAGSSLACATHSFRKKGQRITRL